MKIGLGKDDYIHIQNVDQGVCFVPRAVYDQMQKEIEDLRTQVAILQTENDDSYKRGITAGYLKLRTESRKNK